MRAYAVLFALGLLLLTVVGLLGGHGAVIGGGVALVAQVAAVALLRPAMQARSPEFLARWLGGIGMRALALGVLLAVSATHRAALPVMATMLGFLGVLLPLLFVEIRFLK